MYYILPSSVNLVPYLTCNICEFAQYFYIHRDEITWPAKNLARMNNTFDVYISYYPQKIDEIHTE